jgi:hypothetical protein
VLLIKQKFIKRRASEHQAGIIDRRIDCHKNYRSRFIKSRFIGPLCTRIKRNPFNVERSSRESLLRKRDTTRLYDVRARARALVGNNDFKTAALSVADRTII